MGKPKYLLSGLLRCDVCDAHYTIINATSYGCSGYHDGRACGNSILVRRDRVENILLGPIRDDLLKPDRVARMAREMQGYFSDRVQAVQARVTEAPRELEELEARIARLRDRLKRGDPDMPEDELQAAIDRAEEKHRELQEQLSAHLPAKALVFMSRAAELYRRQVTLGLDGNAQAALKARVFLREWFGGKIRLEPLPDGGLQAHWNQNAGALLKGLGTYGSGGAILNWKSLKNKKFRFADDVVSRIWGSDPAHTAFDSSHGSNALISKRFFRHIGSGMIHS